MVPVHLSVRAARFLDSLDAHLSERIRSSLKRLEDNPVPSDAKFIGRIQGEKLFRYRIGDYRALYLVHDNLVLITKIDKRPRIYER